MHLRPPLINGLDVLPSSHIPMRRIDWVWQDWVATGKLHILAGPPSTGKTTLAIALAAALSNGGTDRGRWPDGTLAPLGRVLIWSGEDGIDDVIVPRLEAAGANRDHVFVLRGTCEGGRNRPFDFQRDLPLLLRKVEEIGDIKLVIIDSIVQVVPGDSNKNSEVRRSLEPLVQMAEACGFAILGLTHVNKGSAGKEPLERVTGSLAYGAVARVVLLTAKSEADAFGDGQPHCVLVRAKSNLGPSDGAFAYRISAAMIPQGLNILRSSMITWSPTPIEGTARDILRAAAGHPAGPKVSKRDIAIEFVQRQLADGPLLCSELEARAKAANISDATLRRAREALGVQSDKQRGVGAASPNIVFLPSVNLQGEPYGGFPMQVAPVPVPGQLVGAAFMPGNPQQLAAGSAFAAPGEQFSPGTPYPYHPDARIPAPFVPPAPYPNMTTPGFAGIQVHAAQRSGPLVSAEVAQVAQVEQVEQVGTVAQVARVDQVDHRPEGVCQEVWEKWIGQCHQEHLALWEKEGPDEWCEYGERAVDNILIWYSDWDESLLQSVRKALLACFPWG